MVTQDNQDYRLQLGLPYTGFLIRLPATNVARHCCCNHYQEQDHLHHLSFQYCAHYYVSTYSEILIVIKLVVGFRLIQSGILEFTDQVLA